MAEAVWLRLGAKVTVIEFLPKLLPLNDAEIAGMVHKSLVKQGMVFHLDTKVTGARSDGKQVIVTAESKSGPITVTGDKVLVSTGRRPITRDTGLETVGVQVDPKTGKIPVNHHFQTNVPNIYALGDIIAGPMLAHKAVHEAHVAAEVAQGQASFFDARQIPSVAYTDPEVAWAGKTEEQCKAEGIKYGKAVFPWAASGRAIANGRDEGFTKLIFDEATHRVIGGGIVGTHAGDLISEVCLAVEMGCEPTDIGKTIHPHPTLGESIGMAAEVFEGHCTDLPPQKK